MANWRCGASACGGHPNSATRCPSGTWFCGRTNPACPGHAHPSDRCTTGTAWTCGADDCLTHGNPADDCDPGRWRCGRQTPPCGGHADRNHVCRGDLTASAEAADADFSDTAPAIMPASRCDAADRIIVVELVEVVAHGGSTTTRATAGRRQFINLDDRVDSGTAHPEFGRRITLKARVEWSSGDRSRPLAGHSVYWRITAAAGNKTGLPDEGRAGFDSAGSNTLRKSTTTDNQGWTPTVDVFLSAYSGDGFDVYATENSGHAGGLRAGPYQVWKKFWYQVTEMRDGTATGIYDLPAAVTTALETGYRASFIELEEQGPRTRANHVSNLENHRDRRNVANPHFRNDSFCPFKAQITTIDWSGTAHHDEDVSDVMTAATWESQYFLLWRHDSGARPWKRRAQYRLTEGLKWPCRRVGCPRDHDRRGDRCWDLAGRRWNCGAQGCPGTHHDPTDVCSEPGAIFHCNRVTPPCGGHPGRSDVCPTGTAWNCGELHCPGNHAGSTDVCGGTTRWTDIPDANLSEQAHPTQRGFKKVVVNFGSGPVYPSAMRRVEIRFRIRRAADSIALGWGGGCQQFFLCTGALRDINPSSDWNPMQSSDCVHELGHALGLVNMAPSARRAHDVWLDRSHANHCNKPPAGCTMFWQSSTTRATTFHMDGGVGCADHLRRQDFSRSIMTSHWR